ncbi:hypothetical protein QFC21_007028 [Naganishia friedmannii]|uniref:Uncharacterized protein n=1 Tax=Naganishia friedmannii TaxID=89922 RepID=A0ACC2UXV8_9TREE|nr:hypothetical protein QFC21_007028 [Naganishia friedmannii]
MALLNKLTPINFGSIGEQIVSILNAAEKEEDGCTSFLVMNLIVTKAKDESKWSPLYADLCVKLCTEVSPTIRDESTTDTKGDLLMGSALLRHYAAEICRKSFNNDCMISYLGKDNNVALSQGHSMSDFGINIRSDVPEFSDEYYAIQRSKRHALGILKFSRELFARNLITIQDVEPMLSTLLCALDEHAAEALCQLLSVTGSMLEAKSSAVLEHCMAGLSAFRQIWDMIALRKSGWITYPPRSAYETMVTLTAEQVKKAHPILVTHTKYSDTRDGNQEDTPCLSSEQEKTLKGHRPPHIITGTSFKGNGLQDQSKRTFLFSRRVQKPSSTNSETEISLSTTASTDIPKVTTASRLSQGGSQTAVGVDSTLGVPRDTAVETQIDNDLEELWGRNDKDGTRNPGDILAYFEKHDVTHRIALATRLIRDAFRLGRMSDTEIIAQGLSVAYQHALLHSNQVLPEQDPV